MFLVRQTRKIYETYFNSCGSYYLNSTNVRLIVYHVHTLLSERSTEEKLRREFIYIPNIMKYGNFLISNRIVMHFTICLSRFNIEIFHYRETLIGSRDNESQTFGSMHIVINI